MPLGSRTGFAAAARRRAAEIDGTVGFAGAIEEAIEARRASRENRQIPFLRYSVMLPEPKTGTLDFDRFPFQPEIYTVFGSRTREAVGMKCLAPETRVLTDGLRWVEIGDVLPGDSLLGVDEFPREGTSARRRMVRSGVRKVWRSTKEGVRLVLADGTEVVAGVEHPFLARSHPRAGGEWVEAGLLRSGMQVRRVVDTWDDPTAEDGWIGGLLDGEGHLALRRTGVAVVISQKHGRVYDRAVGYLRERGYHYRESVVRHSEGREVGRIELSRTEEVLRLIGTTQPVRFASDWWHERGLPGKGDSWVDVVAAESSGVSEMVDIETTTRTFVAAGLVSHNSTQVGFSACTVRVAFYVADIDGENAMYVFPTLGDMYDFVDDRVAGMQDRSEYLQGRMSGHKGLKTLGFGKVYFRGSNARAGLQSAAIDVLILDEYDDLTPKHIPDAERRISGSLNGRIRRLGVPSYPDFGLHGIFARSDQRLWLVRCEECRHRGGEYEGKPIRTPPGYGWQWLDFFENIDQERRIPICAGCQKPLDVRNGQWVPQNPDSRVPGFHVTRLMVPTIYMALSDGAKAVDDIITASRAKDDFGIQAFWNKDLGLPFEPKEGRITLEALQAARSLDIGWVQQPGYVGGGIVTMGVDVATTRALNVRISEHLDDERQRKRALFVGEVEDDPGGGPDAFTKLCEMMERYQVNMAVVDHEPDGRLARAFAQRFPGRVYVHSYSMNAKDAVSVDAQQKHVTTHRTRAMDATRKVMQQQRNILPQDLPEDYVPHMRAPVRKLRENSMGEKVSFYESRSPDDYYHAETYDIVAREVLVVQWEIEEAEREVYTPLDSMMPFQRSVVDDLDDASWRAGPEAEEGEDAGYSAGWNDDLIGG